MLALAYGLIEAPLRTPAIYRCPAVEAESKFFSRLVEEGVYDSVCIEPQPGPNARRQIAGKLKSFPAAKIDTRRNARWRDATIAFISGTLSPKAWLLRTQGLGETVHFLSYPKAPNLRAEIGDDSVRAVQAEMFVLALPGRPCFTAEDTGSTRNLPGPGRLESWLLAMNDHLGPLLTLRHDFPFLVTSKPKVLRADPQPGLFIFTQRAGKTSFTFYVNNGKERLALPKLNLDNVTTSRSLDLEGASPRLGPCGFLIESSGTD